MARDIHIPNPYVMLTAIILLVLFVGITAGGIGYLQGNLSRQRELNDALKQELRDLEEAPTEAEYKQSIMDLEDHNELVQRISRRG